MPGIGNTAAGLNENVTRGGAKIGIRRTLPPACGRLDRDDKFVLVGPISKDIRRSELMTTGDEHGVTDRGRGGGGSIDGGGGET